MSTRTERWSDLSPLTRIAIVKVAVLDVGLRGWALADLARRPQAEVKGSKAGWAVALAVVSSAGILPAAYLLRARRAA